MCKKCKKSARKNLWNNKEKHAFLHKISCFSSVSFSNLLILRQFFQHK